MSTSFRSTNQTIWLYVNSSTKNKLFGFCGEITRLQKATSFSLLIEKISNNRSFKVNQVIKHHRHLCIIVASWQLGSTLPTNAHGTYRLMTSFLHSIWFDMHIFHCMLRVALHDLAQAQSFETLAHSYDHINHCTQCFDQVGGSTSVRQVNNEDEMCV